MGKNENGAGTGTPLVCPTAPAVECTLERVDMPWGHNICYLAEKAQYGFLFPIVSIKRSGQKVNLKQIAMALAIIKEEKEHDYFWSYKAEVCFAMRGRHDVPIPMLSTSDSNFKRYGYINRPHSSNWFAKPKPEDWATFGVNRMRRPDIILVKNKEKRWPGRECTYFDGQSYTDNLKLLIEVKYPPDNLTRGQEEDYTLIATKERFGVLVVRERKDEDDSNEPASKSIPVPETASEEASETVAVGDSVGVPAPVPAPAPGDKPVEQPPGNKPETTPEHEQPDEEKPAPPPNVHPFPGRKPKPEGESELEPQPLPEPEPVPVAANEQFDIRMPLYTENPGETRVWKDIPRYEYWVQLTEDVKSLLENGYTQLSDLMTDILQQCGKWLTEKGQWIYNEFIDPVTNEIKKTYQWLSDITGEVIEFTEEQLKAMWRQVEDATEWTVETLAKIDWVQVLTDLKNGLVEVLVFIGEVIVGIICAVAVVAAIVALVAIVTAIAAMGSAAAAAISAFFAMLSMTMLPANA